MTECNCAVGGERCGRHGVRPNRRCCRRRQCLRRCTCLAQCLRHCTCLRQCLWHERALLECLELSPSSARLSSPAQPHSDGSDYNGECIGLPARLMAEAHRRHATRPLRSVSLRGFGSAETDHSTVRAGGVRTSRWCYEYPSLAGVCCSARRLAGGTRLRRHSPPPPGAPAARAAAVTVPSLLAE